MRHLIVFLSVIALLGTSCTQSKYATSGSAYENDEVYYQPGDTYISDFALVDNEADAVPVDGSNAGSSSSTAPANEDDYYDGNTQSQSTDGITNNYYGN